MEKSDSLLCWQSLFALGALLLFGNLSLNAQSTPTGAPLGDAVVLRVSGTASIQTAPNSAPEAITPMMRIREGARLSTGPASSVSLVFSNGSNLTVGANADLEFRELRQTPFQTEGTPSPTYGALPAEPSVSSTELYLHQGEVLGEVRGLKRESRFDITTRVGTAGIRGTIFQINLTIQDGVVSMEVINVQGEVVFASADLGIAPTLVPAGEGTEVRAEFNAATGELTLVSSDNQTPPPVILEVARARAIEVTQTAQDASVPPAGESESETPPTEGSSEDTEDESDEEEDPDDLSDEIEELIEEITEAVETGTPTAV